MTKCVLSKCQMTKMCNVNTMKTLFGHLVRSTLLNWYYNLESFSFIFIFTFRHSGILTFFGIKRVKYLAIKDWAILAFSQFWQVYN